MATETQTKQLWICTSCGFIYDPAEGDPDGGIPPGTAFEDIPDDWFCPVCGARKADFEPYEDPQGGTLLGCARRCQLLEARRARLWRRLRAGGR